MVLWLHQCHGETFVHLSSGVEWRANPVSLVILALAEV